MGFEPRAFQFWLKCLNPLGCSLQNSLNLLALLQGTNYVFKHVTWYCLCGKNTGKFSFMRWKSPRWVTTFRNKNFVQRNLIELIAASTSSVMLTYGIFDDVQIWLYFALLCCKFFRKSLTESSGPLDSAVTLSNVGSHLSSGTVLQKQIIFSQLLGNRNYIWLWFKLRHFCIIKYTFTENYFSADGTWLNKLKNP